MADEHIRVFISHSSRDKALVERLIDLLVSALHLRSESIRATSVDGHRMKGGANPERALRREVEEAEVLVGVLTPDSLGSLYVAFELGGRWVTGRPLVLLLAPGADTGLLEGPGENEAVMRRKVTPSLTGSPESQASYAAGSPLGVPVLALHVELDPFFVLIFLLGPPRGRILLLRVPTPAESGTPGVLIVPIRRLTTLTLPRMTACFSLGLIVREDGAAWVQG